MDKINPELFVEGRDAYVAKVPLLQVLERGTEIGAEIEKTNALHNDDPRHYVDPVPHVLSFAFGFLDGVLNDIREAADWAREERKA